MVAQTIQQPAATKGLRNVLRVDAVVSGLCGLGLVADAQPVGAFLGFEAPAALEALGAGLLVWAGVLWWRSSREPVDPRHVRVVAIANVAWVVASAAILVAGVPALSEAGRWAVLAVADVVAILAAVQFWLARRAHA